MMRLRAWWWRQTRAYCSECGRDYRVTQTTQIANLNTCSRDCADSVIRQVAADYARRQGLEP